MHPTPLPLLAEPSPFSSENGLSAAGKRDIFADWQRFVRGDFNRPWLTPGLLRCFHEHCGLPPWYSGVEFWRQYFAGDVHDLKAFLNQFGGDRCHLIEHNHAWLTPPATALDLKQAMCDWLTPLAPAMLHLLDGVEQQHRALPDFWQHVPGLLAPPPAYQVTVNTRRLLGYVARTVQVRPLAGLQLLMFDPRTETGKEQ